MVYFSLKKRNCGVGVVNVNVISNNAINILADRLRGRITIVFPGGGGINPILQGQYDEILHRATFRRSSSSSSHVFT